MSHWEGKHVVIIGAARQGLALARYLVRHGAHVVLNDHRPEGEFWLGQQSLSDLPVEWVFGGHPMSLLDQVDLVCPSGGVPLTIPLLVEAQHRGIPLSNDSQVFLEDAPCKVIGITGSAGKSTTTSLVGRMSEAATDVCSTGHSQRVWVGGNIGSPLIALVDDMQVEDLAVMELSSFQLELMTNSPQVAAILNLTPNHLDRHKTMAAYTAAKAKILEYQSPSDLAILGYNDPGAWGLLEKTRGKVITFALREPPADLTGTYLRGDFVVLRDGMVEIELFSRKSIALRGEHNLLNVLAACAIAFATGLPLDTMREGVKGFEGMPHRLEYVRSWRGADWYNDSIATAPERTIAAIKSFDEPLVLLAGGRDKELPWDDFASIVRHRIDHVILFGEAVDKIAGAIEANSINNGSNNQRPYSLTRCTELKEAIQAAMQLVENGDVVLLSPGGTSYDEFRDFEDRGEAFKRWVKALP